MPRPTSKPESAIQKEILKYLNELPGCKAYKIIAGNERGIPDILACYRGYFIGFEVKKPDKHLEPIQAAQMRSINNAGGYAFTVHNTQEASEAILVLESEKFRVKLN